MPDSRTASLEVQERVLDAIKAFAARGIDAPRAEALAERARICRRQVYVAMDCLESARRIRRHRIEILDGGER